MSIYPPPTQSGLIFDLDNWVIASSDNSASLQYLYYNYVKYPTAQWSVIGLTNSTTGNMTVAGPTICNNIYNYSSGGSVPTNAYIYNTTTGSGFKIRIGGSMGAGRTIQIGGPFTAYSIPYNINYIGNWIQSTVIESISRAKLDYADATANIGIGDLQTTGILELGCGDFKAERIGFGINASGVNTINVGGALTTTNIIGPVLVNSGKINIANNVVVVNNADYILSYTFDSNDTLIHNKSTIGYTLFLPSTIPNANFGFWIFTENFSYTINSPVYNITFGKDTSTSFVMQQNSTAYVFSNNATSSFVLAYASNQIYKYPTYAYPLISSLSYTSPVNGTLYFTNSNSITRSASAGTTLNLSCTLLTGGIFYFETTLTINIVTAGTALTLGGQTSAVVLTNNDPTTAISNFYYEQPLSTVISGYTSGTNNIIKYGTAGFYTNNTVNQVIYGYARVFGAITNTGYTYQVVNNFNVWKIG
jgi:hypothetical protein